MKNTNPIFSLKNFRSFGEEGADFELAPITVLTGCNSAGKSSLVKGLLLASLDKILEGTKNGGYVEDFFPPTELKVFSSKLELGSFNKIINENAQDGEIVMAYKMWSYYLHEDVIVKMVFEAQPGLLNNGELICLSIEKKNGNTIYSVFRNDKIPFESGKTTSGWDNFDGLDEIDDNWNIYLKVGFYNYLKYRTNTNNPKGLRRLSYAFIQEMEKPKGPISELDMFFHSIDNLSEGERPDNYPLNPEDREKEMLRLKEELGDTIDDYNSSDRWGYLFENLCNLTREENAELNNYEKYRSYYNNHVINECLHPWFLIDVVYIDSSSTRVKRKYNIKDEDKLCLALSNWVKYGKPKTGKFVNSWLKKFDITDNENEDCIEVVAADEGDGDVMIYLNKGGRRRLLADEGYGITQLFSLLIQIETRIREYKPDEMEVVLGDQPVEYPHRFIAIEEPEIHLHPKYQSLLADMFVEANQTYHIHFIIETHSEYLIRKLQVLVAENKLKPSEVSLNYVDKDKKGVSHNRQIEIQDDGGLSESFGSGFFDESDRLAIDLFRLKPILP